MPTKRTVRESLAAIALLGAVACSGDKSPTTPAAPTAARPVAPGPAGNSATPGAVHVCRANFDFAVEVGGTYPPDARLLQSDARGKFLVDIPSQGKSLMVDLAGRRVTTVPPGTIDRDPDTGLVRFTEPGPEAGPAYALAIEGAVLRFQTETSPVRVLQALEREPIVGPVAFDALVSDRAEYREGMKAYRPNLDAVAKIRQSKQPVEIEAYFGTWCGHCKMFMPKFLRVMQDAANPSIRMTLIGVPKGFGNVDGPWKGKNITGIPAIIVSRKGGEMARLGNDERAVPEAELAAILGSIN